MRGTWRRPQPGSKGGKGERSEDGFSVDLGECQLARADAPSYYDFLFLMTSQCYPKHKPHYLIRSDASAQAIGRGGLLTGHPRAVAARLVASVDSAEVLAATRKALPPRRHPLKAFDRRRRCWHSLSQQGIPTARCIATVTLKGGPRPTDRNLTDSIHAVNSSRPRNP